MELETVAQAFIEMAHRIVWCTAATVDRHNRPRSRILHPYWQWQEGELVGWICTGPTPSKAAHLAHSPYMSCSYWNPEHDTCVAECLTQWCHDMPTREATWKLFEEAPAPVGYSPSIVPGWSSPAAEAFGVLKLRPWRLRVFPGGVLLRQLPPSSVLNWESPDSAS